MTYFHHLIQTIKNPNPPEATWATRIIITTGLIAWWRLPSQDIICKSHDSRRTTSIMRNCHANNDAFVKRRQGHILISRLLLINDFLLDDNLLTQLENGQPIRVRRLFRAIMILFLEWGSSSTSRRPFVCCTLRRIYRCLVWSGYPLEVRRAFPIVIFCVAASSWALFHSTSIYFGRKIRNAVGNFFAD